MSLISWVNWEPRWEAAIRACQRLGGTTCSIVRAKPATAESIEAVEAELGFRIPGTFRTVLKEYSSHVQFRWQLPDNLEAPFRGLFSGECYWDLSAIVKWEQNRQKWVRVCFSDESDPYDRVWHNKLTFLHVSNGDYIALDLAFPAEPPVVFLSHDDGEGHGYVLGESFIDFVDRWSLLACPGAEDWQMMPFLPSPSAGLDPDCGNANTWRKWFGFAPDA